MKIGDKVKFSNEYLMRREKNGIMANLRLLKVIGFSKRGGVRVVANGCKTPMVYHKDLLIVHI